MSAISQSAKKGDTLDILPPDGVPFLWTVPAMKNEDGETIEAAPHAMQKLTVVTDTVIPKGSLLRKKRNVSAQ